MSKHLPREIQITLMTREVADIDELEQILDIFQNIRDWEMGRCPNPPASHTNGNYNQSRGSLTAYRGARGGNNNNNRGEDWRCSECHFGNFAIRTVCYRCSKARSCQWNNTASNQHSSSKEVTIAAEECPEEVELQLGVEAVSYTHLDVYKRQNEYTLNTLTSTNCCLLYTSRCV